MQVWVSHGPWYIESNLWYSFMIIYSLLATKACYHEPQLSIPRKRRIDIRRWVISASISIINVLLVRILNYASGIINPWNYGYRSRTTKSHYHLQNDAIDPIPGVTVREGRMTHVWSQEAPVPSISPGVAECIMTF